MIHSAFQIDCFFFQFRFFINPTPNTVNVRIPPPKPGLGILKMSGSNLTIGSFGSSVLPNLLDLITSTGRSKTRVIFKYRAYYSYAGGPATMSKRLENL